MSRTKPSAAGGAGFSRRHGGSTPRAAVKPPPLLPAELALPAELPAGVDRAEAQEHLDRARDPALETWERVVHKHWLKEQGALPADLLFPEGLPTPGAKRSRPPAAAAAQGPPEPERPPRLRALTAENLLLRGMLALPETVPEVREIAPPDAFGSMPNRRICRAILALADAGKPIDLVLLRAGLAHDETALACQAAPALEGILLLEPPERERMLHYAGLVRDLYLEHAEDLDRRKIASLAADGKVRNGVFRGEVATILEAIAAREHPESPEADLRLWPEPAGAAVYHGISGDVLRAVAPHTEADPMAILGQFLVAFGSMAGRHPCWYHEETRHGLNLFLVLVGATALGVKGTALNIALRALDGCDPDWTPRVGLISGEGLVHTVRDAAVGTGEHQRRLFDAGVDDKRCLFVEREFGAVLSVKGRKGSTLSEHLRLAWDGDQLGIASRNNPATATGHHISLIGHITFAELDGKLFDEDKANGFGNRFIWICSRKSQVLPASVKAPRIDWEGDIRPRIRAALKFARSDVHFKQGLVLPCDDEATALWCAVYPSLEAPGAGLLGALKGRAKPIVKRLAAIYAVLDCSPWIRHAHLAAALEYWAYCCRSVDFVFGGQRAAIAPDQRVLAAILEAGPEGLGLNQISRKFFRSESSLALVHLGWLVRDGVVRQVQQHTAGRPRTAYVALKHLVNEEVDN